MKRILIFILTLSLAFTMIACKDNNSESESSSESSSESVKSEEESGTSGNDEYAQYSKILQEVLTNDYYNNLLAQAKVDASLYSSAKFATHPYGFLEREGFDIDAIKNGELDCRSYTFYKTEEPNNLYMAVYAEKEEGIYNEYLIRYKLTEQEMYDYKMLYTMPENSSNADTCLQVFFINDAVSRTKSAEIVSECRSTVEAHESIIKDSSFKRNICDIKLDGKNKQFDVIVKSVDEENSRFTLLIFTIVNRSVAGTNSTQIGEMQFEPMIGVNIKISNDLLISSGQFNASFIWSGPMDGILDTKTFGIGWTVKDMVNFKEITSIEYGIDK